MLAKTGRGMKTSPRADDKIIGANLRRIRLIRGMSQEKLGDAIGLTFQQIQKYEKGTNRIGGSRMAEISAKLNVPVTELFKGVDGKGGYAVDTPAPVFTDPYHAFATIHGAASFVALTNALDDKSKKVLVRLCNELAIAFAELD